MKQTHHYDSIRVWTFPGGLPHVFHTFLLFYTLLASFILLSIDVIGVFNGSWRACNERLLYLSTGM